MEKTVNSTEMGKTRSPLKIGINVVLLVAAAVGVLHIASFIPLIDQINSIYIMYYGALPTAGDILYQVYVSLLWISVLMAALSIWLLFINWKKELMARIFIWGLFLLTLMKLYPFFAEMFLLPTYTVADGFTVFEGSTQIVCAAVALLALIVQWDDKYKKAVNNVSLAAMVVSAVFLIIYIIRFDASSSTWSGILYDMLGRVTLLLITIFIFLVTRGRRIFGLCIYGMTDEEAELIEDMEDKLEAQKQQYEEEAIELLEKQIEDELKEMLVERAFDKVIEDTEKLEKAIEDGFDKLEEEENLGEVLDEVLVGAVGGEEDKGDVDEAQDAPEDEK